MKNVFVLIDHPNLDYLLLPVIEEMQHRGGFNIIACICNWGKQELFRKKQIPFVTDPKSFANFYHMSGPKLFLTASDTMSHLLGRDLAKLCCEEGIASLSVEHAAHSVYENWTTKNMFNSDRIALAGEIEFRKYRELGVSAQRLVITGCPKYDQYYQLLANHASTMAPDIAGHEHQTKNMLFAGANQVYAERISPRQWTGILKSIFNFFLQRFPSHTIVVKPHPADPCDNTDILYGDAIDPDWRMRIRIIDSHGSLPHAMLNSDFVVSFTPSVMLEALLMRKPAIHFGGYGAKGSATAACQEAGAIFIHPDWPRIAEVLDQSLPYDGHDGLEKIRISDEFIRKFAHRWDGKASHRIVNLIEKMITHQKIHLRNGVMMKAENNRKIKVSIVMVTYNSAGDIQGCIESIGAHTATPYEIIIIDNCSTDGTRDYLRSLQDATVILNSDNVGFSAGCNQGIKKAGGEYIVLLNPDTLVTGGWDARLISHFTDGVAAVGPVSNYVAGLQKYEFYTEQRLRGPDGIEALAEDLYLRNQGQGSDTKLLIGFCMMIKRRAIEDVGMLDEALFLGNDDLDFSLRLRDRGYKLMVATDTFIYHKGQASFASEPDEKTRALVQASTDALYQKLENKYGVGQIPSSQELWGMDWFKPSKTTPAEDKLTSIVILTHNQLEYTRKCLESVVANTHPAFELIIVDNASSDGTVQYLETTFATRHQDLNMQVIQNTENLGFAAGNNQGLASARGDYILLLNNDVVVTPAWLERLQRCAQRASEVGMVGPMTNNTNGPQRVEDVSYNIQTLQGLHQFSEQFARRHLNHFTEFWRPVGFCMLIKREVVERIGGLDERFGLGNFEDDDWCLRAYLAGFKALIANDCFVHHFGGRTFKGANLDYQASLEKNWDIFKAKWNIPKEVPYGPTYDVKLPGAGFDPDKHYIALPHNSADSTMEKAGANDITSKLKKADIYYQRDELDRALNMFLEAIRDAPEQTASYYALAETLIDAKKFSGALEVLNEIPGKDQDVRKLTLTGYCREGLQDYAAADALANQVLDADPGFALAHNLKGILAYRQEKLSDAETHFKAAIEKEPAYGEPYTNLGTLKWENGEVEAALDLFEDGFRKSPNAADIVQIYHAAIKACGRYERSERVFENVLRRCPDNKRLSCLFIDVLIQQAKYAQAMDVIESAVTDFDFDADGLTAAMNVRQLLGPLEITPDADSPPTVSLCMIVKNEARYLANCLASVKPLVDEIIVVDTGSTDHTKTIAEIFGAKVFDYKWEDDYAAARNHSLPKASGQWILVMDADEVLSPVDYDKFKMLMESENKEPVAYSIVTRNYTMRSNTVGWAANTGEYPEEAGVGWFPSEKVRLFPNRADIRFEYPVHELVDPCLQRAGIRIETCPIPVHHYGDLNPQRTDDKGKGYYDIGSRKLDQSNQDVVALRELAVQAGNLEKYGEAVDYWQQLLALQPDMPEAYVNLGSAYWQLGDYTAALTAARKAVSLDPQMKEARFNEAISELFLGNLQKAIPILEELVQEYPDYLAARFMLSAAYCCSDGWEKGMQGIQVLGQSKMGKGLCFAFEDLASRLIAARKENLAVNVLEAAIQSHHSNDNILALRERVAGMNSSHKAVGIADNRNPLGP